MNALKPQDLLLMLKLLLRGDQGPAPLSSIAREIGVSPAEAHNSIRRSLQSQIFDPVHQRPHAAHLHEFIVHGLRYAWPAAIGPLIRGIPTAHSAPPLARLILSDKEQRYVWPSSEGRVLGFALEPIYPSVPIAASFDDRLYEVLALIDAMRIGRVRERKIAAEELGRRLLGLRHGVSH